MKKGIKAILLTFVCVLLITLAPQTFSATEESNPKPSVDKPIINTDYPTLSKKNKTTTLRWFSATNAEELYGMKQTYEIQRSTSKKFTKSTTKSIYTSKTYYNFKRAGFGDNGGTFYFRVRVWLNRGKEDAYSSKWSDTKTFNFVKINKTNFPGLYTILKNGGYYNTVNSKGDYVEAKYTYDKNGDGWLDPDEINNVTTLSSISRTKKKNGIITSYPTAKVSSLKGVNYLTNLYSVHLVQYSGKTMDLSKNKQIGNIYVTGITASSITVNAPTATNIHIEPPFDSNLKKIDLSKCRNAKYIYAYGADKNPTKTLKLPTYKKNLRSLSLSCINMSTVDLNAYTNLGEIYLYEMNLTKVKVNKCTNLKYFYLYECDKIKSVDLTANKKLIGASSTYCNKMTKSNFKVRKGATLKMNTGKWWYGTEKYKKFQKSIQDAKLT